MTDPEGILTAVADAVGRELDDVRLAQVEVAGAGHRLGFDCTLRDHSGATETVRFYLETPAEAGAGDRDGVLVLRDEDSSACVAVWQYPGDPHLPALRAAAYPQGAAVLLGRLGLPTSGDQRMLSYRPGKRAVIRVGDDRFLKIVRPESVQRIRSAHAAFADAGIRVPDVLGYSAEGLIVLDRLPGLPATERIEQIADDDRFLRGLDRLTARISSVALTVPTRTSPTARVDWYAGELSRLLPSDAERIRAVADAVARDRRADPPGDATIHGDLHLGQIFVDPDEPWRIIGVLDIDTAGAGDRSDDVGGLLAHARVCALLCGRDGFDRAADAYGRLVSRLRARPPATGTSGRLDAVAAAHHLAHALGFAAHAAYDESGPARDIARALIADAEAGTLEDAA